MTMLIALTAIIGFALAYLAGNGMLATDVDAVSIHELNGVEPTDAELCGIRKGVLIIPLIKIAKHYYVPERKNKLAKLYREMMEKISKVVFQVVTLITSVTYVLVDEKKDRRHTHLVIVETTCILC